MIPVELFPVILVVHISLALALFLPSFLLPFAFRTRRGRAVSAPAAEGHGRVVGGLLWLQANGTLLIGAGLAVTGLSLVTILGASLLRQPWLLAALAIYGANLAVAYFVQRPGVRRLLRLPSSGSPDEQERWRTLARRQRYVSYLMAGATGIIAFLMSTKPGA